MDIEEQYDKIYRYCYFKLYDKQLAQDITQETFLHFYRQDLSLDNSRELPYLYTIAKNLCIDVFRKKPTDSLEDMNEEAIYDPSMIVVIPEQYRVLAQVWDWLPWCFLAPWNVFGQYTVSIFGHYFTSWQAAPIIYLVASIVIATVGKPIYQRFQVSGR